MKEKNLNERKARVLTIVAVVLLLIVVIGAAYAYFRAQVGNGTNISINATAGTIDSLTFNMQDIDITSIDKKIIDNNNQEEGKDNTEIVIEANQDNFKENGNSIGDGVEASANLIANNATDEATYIYNIYLDIAQNNFEYSVSSSTPELLLLIQKPDGTYLSSLSGLSSSTITIDGESVNCFDITKKSGSITIAEGEEINASLDTDGKKKKSGI